MPGSPTALVTFRDLTEQDQLAQMRADFVANASHELRTPLASLRGFVETLQGPARDDAAARERFLAIMASQAERIPHRRRPPVAVAHWLNEHTPPTVRSNWRRSPRRGGHSEMKAAASR
jgi:hypothetical protein